MEAFRGAVEKIMGRATDDQQLDCALMASVQKQLTEVADAVAAVRPLAELPEPEKRECAKTSAVKRYAATSVVYVCSRHQHGEHYSEDGTCNGSETSPNKTDDDRDSNDADAHFVLEGRCTCVQRLHVRKSMAFGRDRFTLVQRRRGQHGKNVRTVYVKMSELRPGSVFGLGERRSGSLVVATTDVKCLLVPVAFLTKNNTSNIWGRTICSLDGSNPTIEQSFRKFVVENRWEEYKKSLAEHTFQQHVESSQLYR